MFSRPPVRSEPGQIREGFTYVLHHPLLRMLCAGPLVTGMFLGVSAAVYPQLAKFTFDADAGAFGLMGTMIGVGSAIGALSAARITHITTRLIMFATVGTGTAVLATALAPTLTVEYLVLPFAGAFMVLQAVTTITKLQLTTTPELRGRAVALYFMVSAAGAALGSFALGSLAQAWGPRWAIAVNVAVAFVLVGAWARYRRRTGDDDTHAP
jgi:MFS family permease